jgi:hypothetical protein
MLMVQEAGFLPSHNQRLCLVLILTYLRWRMLMVQEAGFEPANRYGLGPHPSAFDQAGQLLRWCALNPRVFQNRESLVSC